MCSYRMNWAYLLCEKNESPVSSKNDDSLNCKQDKRSIFKKDFDTICNSACIRRLQDKAQVFPLERGDFSRTRLTHSIEVMSVAQSLGTYAIKTIKSKEATLNKKATRLIEYIPTILSSASLLHDVGNPPFGHITEDIISDWFKENLGRLKMDKNKLYCDDLPHHNGFLLSERLSENHKNDLLRFDGNAQVLRLATHLQNSLGKKGMNLSYPTLATIIKYPSNYIEDQSNHEMKEKLKSKKRGYFETESEIYQEIQKTLHLNNNRHPLSFLLEASDDISYLVSDIEDACNKGLITIADIESRLQKLSNGDKLVSDFFEKVGIIKKLAKRDKKEEQVIIQQIRVQLKGILLIEAANAFDKKYDEIMTGKYTKELLEESEAFPLVRMLKELLNEKVYYCPEIIRTKLEACAIVKKLLESIILATFNQNGKCDDSASLLYLALSPNYRDVCVKSINKEKEKIKSSKSLTNEEKMKRNDSIKYYSYLVLARDYLVGMTDTFAIDFYKNILALL